MCIATSSVSFGISSKCRGPGVDGHDSIVPGRAAAGTGPITYRQYLFYREARRELLRYGAFALLWSHQDALPTRLRAWAAPHRVRLGDQPSSRPRPRSRRTYFAGRSAAGHASPDPQPASGKSATRKLGHRLPTNTKPPLPIRKRGLLTHDSRLTSRNYPSATIARSTLSRGSAGVTRK